MSGIATGAGTRPDVTLKIAQLQNLCKRDPLGYREDYDAQVRRLRSECGILALSPSTTPSPRLVELIQFAAAVSSSSYKGSESDAIADLLVALLLGGDSTTHAELNHTASPTAASHNKQVNMNIPISALSLHKEVRKSCVSALILMRNKGAVPPLKLMELFFRIMAAVPDKSLREHLYKHLVNDIQNINKKGKRDEKVNRNVQIFLHRVISASSRATHSSRSEEENMEEDGYFHAKRLEEDNESAGDIAAKRAVDMIAELYRRQVWTDERAVAILASAVRSSNASVMCKAIRFFLNIEEKMASDQQKVENEKWDGVNQVDMHLYSKKTKSRQRHAQKQVKKRAKEQVKREQEDQMQREDIGVEASKKLYPAIELLNDPQGLAEVILKRIKASGSNTFKFEQKLLMMNFLTRIVGNHELLLLPLYPLLQRYMGGTQRDVTAILAYTVQACHSLVPPEEIHAILKTIAHNFITERCSGEQMAVGINACRAICARVPSVLSKEDAKDFSSSTTMDVEAFVRDLSCYSKHRDRSVSIAGKSWINFIREVYPSLLSGKDRGSIGSALHRAGEKPLRYGEQRVASGVQGADLLLEYETKKALLKTHPPGKDSQENYDDEDDENESLEDDLAGFSEEEEEEEDTEEGFLEEDDEMVVPLGQLETEEENDGSSDVISDEDDQDEDVAEEEEEDDDDDERMLDEENDDNDDEAPELVYLPNDSKKASAIIDTSKMSKIERDKLRQKVSSTRIFSAGDFVKMRKLVEREEQAKRDPRAAAKLKRKLASGKGFVELSDDDDNNSDDDLDDDERDKQIHVKGVVDPSEIMAEAKKKRASKIERLEKIVAGREKFEHKKREGGSTNTEKKRKKLFVMSKFSSQARMKRNDKETAKHARKNGNKRKFKDNKAESKKRRRRF